MQSLQVTDLVKFSNLPYASLLQRFQLSPAMQWLAGEDARDYASLVTLASAQLDERLARQETSEQSTREAGHKDLMHYLLTNSDSKTGFRPTREQLEGDSLSFIGAGADTVATTLSAILFYLVRHPYALAKLTSELRAAFESVDDLRSGPKLDSCTYLDACIEETLRLSPAVPSQLPREVMKGGIVIDDHFVPEGTVVGVPAYVVHHDETAFLEPWSFRPERWIATGEVSEEQVKRAREAMCAFSLGPRGCVGKKLAYMEMKFAIASLLWTYDVMEAPDAGQNGGGDPALEEGRRRRGEFQLFDCFGSDREGPVLCFRRRS
jgi:cytochrome P450